MRSIICFFLTLGGTIPTILLSITPSRRFSPLSLSHLHISTTLFQSHSTRSKPAAMKSPCHPQMPPSATATRKRRLYLSPLPRLCLLVLFLRQEDFAGALEILSKSRLERCVKVSDSDKLDCNKKVVVNVAVPSGSVRFCVQRDVARDNHTFGGVPHCYLLFWDLLSEWWRGVHCRRAGGGGGERHEQDADYTGAAGYHNQQVCCVCAL